MASRDRIGILHHQTRGRQQRAGEIPVWEGRGIHAEMSINRNIAHLSSSPSPPQRREGRDNNHEKQGAEE